MIHRSEKHNFIDDPFLAQQIAGHIHEGLAQERKRERDRLAQELIDNMSKQLGGSSVRSGVTREQDRAYGIEQIPSDDMNEIMHNNFNRMYLSYKSSRDQHLDQLRREHHRKLKEIRDTHSNKLKTEVQQKKARDLAEETGPQY